MYSDSGIFQFLLISMEQQLAVRKVAQSTVHLLFLKADPVS